MLLLASAAMMAAAQDPALGRRALAFLASQARSADAEVRAAVASAWGEIGSKGALPLLKEAVKDPDDSVRVAAASSLQKFGDLHGSRVLEEVITRPTEAPQGKPSPAQELKQRAKDKIRAEAALKLADLGSERVVRVLEKTLAGDRSAAVRDAAAIALCRLGLDDEGNFADRFLNAMESDDEFVRAEAVRSLGLTKTEVAYEALRDAAGDPSPLVRAAAMTALVNYPSPQTRGLLDMALVDEQPRVRLSAAAALAELRDPEAAGALRGELKPEKDKAQQLVAMKGLARLGETIDLTLAKRQLESPDVDARLLAVETIAASKSEESWPLLSRVMDSDAAPRLRVRAAAMILRKLKGDEEAKPATPVPEKPTAAPMPGPKPQAPQPQAPQGPQTEKLKGLPGLGGPR